MRWEFTAPASPDELVKHSGAVGSLSQHHSAAVAAQQHLLKHRALQREHQGVSLDHLHLVSIGRLHTERNITSVPLNQQGLQPLQQGLGVADGVSITASFLGEVSFEQTCFQRVKTKKEMEELEKLVHVTFRIQLTFIACQQVVSDYLLGQIVGQYHENQWH